MITAKDFFACKKYLFDNICSEINKIPDDFREQCFPVFISGENINKYIKYINHYFREKTNDKALIACDCVLQTFKQLKSEHALFRCYTTFLYKELNIKTAAHVFYLFWNDNTLTKENVEALFSITRFLIGLIREDFQNCQQGVPSCFPLNLDHTEDDCLDIFYDIKEHVNEYLFVCAGGTNVALPVYTKESIKELDFKVRVAGLRGYHDWYVTHCRFGFVY